MHVHDGQFRKIAADAVDVLGVAVERSGPLPLPPIRNMGMERSEQY